ncbi:MAG: hypothetical protein BWK80_27320 [Desulfobacteraceae bacterium IS3]|nr:MAG: hypothetical protein BWK80_27320 [Desulfobacteraceae bacterium IS3]
MSIQPQGEDLRKAVKWISEEQMSKHKKGLDKLIEEACIRFNLSPKDSEFLRRFVMEQNQ